MACVCFDQYGSNFNNNGEEFNKWIAMCSMDRSLIFDNIDDFTSSPKKSPKKCYSIPKNLRKIKIIQYRCGKKEVLQTIEVCKPHMLAAVEQEETKKVDAGKPATLPSTLMTQYCDMGFEKTQEVVRVKPTVVPPAVRKANMKSALYLNDDNELDKCIQMCTQHRRVISRKQEALPPAVLKPNMAMTMGHRKQQNTASAKPMTLPPMQKSQRSSQPLEDRPTAYREQNFTVDKKRKHVSVKDDYDYDSRLEATKQKLRDSYGQIKEAKKQRAIQVIEFQKPVEQRKSNSKPNVKTSIHKKLLAMKAHNKYNKFRSLVY